MSNEGIVESIRKIAIVAAKEEIIGNVPKLNERARETFLDEIKGEEFERRVLEIVFGNESALLKAFDNRKKSEKKWDDVLAYIDEHYNVTGPPVNTTRSGQPWTDGEVAQLEREVSKLISKLAGMYGRTPKAIESKARALGLLGYHNK